MGKRETVLDWQMLEHNAEWPPSVLTEPRVVQPRRLPRRWRWWALAVVLAALLPALAMGYQEVRRANQVMASVENDVRTAVAVEGSVHQRTAEIANTTATLRTGPSFESSLGPRVEGARRVEVRDKYAMVEVWTNTSAISWLPAPYRVTRFYQETARGWLPAQPPDAFYQPLATLQAGRFTFVYGPRDAGAVLAASQQVEAVDADIRTELGLPVTNEALTVRLLTSVLLKMDPVRLVGTSLGTNLYALSPALLPLPAHISERDALLQLVAGLLVKRDLDEALAGSAYPCAWQPLAKGLQRWLLWERSELPSYVRDYAESFRQYGLGRNISPRLAWFGPYHSACMPNEYVQNAGSGTNLGGMATDSAEIIATEFVEYAVSAYGRDRLPALLDGMRRYGTWEKLIPAVYGVSASEFEQGWQDYLAAQYGHSITP